MKFAEHLSAHITPEWRKQYILYEDMKEKLYEALEEAPNPEMTSEELVRHHFGRFDELFFQYCDSQLLKINTFFSEKIAEAARRFSSLHSELEAVAISNHPTTTALTRLGNFVKGKPEATISHRSMTDIKLAFSEFYLSLILLQNYQSLNFTGFRKILKKHDKLLKTDSGVVWRQAKVETAPFYTSKEVDHLIKETESTFTAELEAGDRTRAMKRLRVPPLGEKQDPFTTFRVGLFAGIFIVLTLVALTAGFINTPANDSDWQAALRMFRGSFLVFLFLFLLGVNTYGWRSHGVNHILIFELDPRAHLTHQQFIEIATFFGVLWCVGVIVYLLSNHLNVPPFLSPLILFLFFTLYLLNPIRTFHYKARKWLLRVLFRISTAPFHHVSFADFWLADQLNSLSTVLLDLQYLICFYAFDVRWSSSPSTNTCNGLMYGITPIVSALPAWFRFAQCIRRYRDTREAFPHIANAGKYSTTFIVVIFSSLYSVYKSTQQSPGGIQNNAFFILWIISAIINTCYTYTWDIKMDWGLFDNNNENKFLREEIVYSRKIYYYFAIVNDLVLRLTWTVSLSIGHLGLMNSEVLKTILASLEIFRRFIWNFFRLENEHLNNCGHFRAVRDISIVPVQANDQAVLERMMDEKDGVVNRRSAIKRPRFKKTPSEMVRLTMEEGESSSPS